MPALAEIRAELGFVIAESSSGEPVVLWAAELVAGDRELVDVGVLELEEAER